MRTGWDAETLPIKTHPESKVWLEHSGLGLSPARRMMIAAIGTYASAGAQFGTSLLWTAPATFPMMFAVVYLSSKLGQVTGNGLFHVIKDNYPRWVLWPALVGAVIGK